MKKLIMKISYAVLIISALTYIVSNFYGNETLSNFISPFSAFSSVILIFFGVSNLDKYKVNWFLIAMAALAWGLSDEIWNFMVVFLNVNPESSIILMYFYMIPNFMILASAGLFFKLNFVKWNRSQLTLDLIATSIIAILVFRFSFYNQIAWEDFSLHEKITNIIYWITDISTLCIFIVFISSSRAYKYTKTISILLLGCLLYVLVDLSYVYFYLLNMYTPNTLIDSLYILAMSSFGFAAYFDWKKPETEEGNSISNTPENFGKNYRVIVFALIPYSMYLMKILELEGLISILICIVFYFMLSNYTQHGILNELKLKNELAINEHLEELVSLRTIELRASIEKLEFLSITDNLSKLYNRRYFMNKLDDLIKEGRNYFSVYYLDLDNFKVINDIHGHEMGDVIIETVSERFINWKPDNIYICRVGGDEFAIIHIHDSHNEKQSCIDLCHEIGELFKQKIQVGDYVFSVGISIGVSRFPYDATDRESLVKYADLAMYQAKKSNEGDKYVFYSRQQSAVLERKNLIDLLLKTINYDSEFSLNFQPQISTISNQLIGVEALLRWNNPELGNVVPTEFIRISEENGSIINIGKWVIEKAFKQIKKWNEASLSPIKIGINLSPMQFDAQDFFPFIIEKINEYKVDPSWIDFEVTENIAMNSGTIKEEIFTALSGIGVHISIDDFGTGYSSFSYLKRFDIDCLKIAKELIDHIEFNHEERLIINAIIMMSKGMGIATIAEGVESKEQFEILRDLECDAIQGYYFSKPISAQEFEAKYLTEHKKT